MFRPATTPIFICILALGLPIGLLLIALEGGWREALRFLPFGVLTGAGSAFVVALIFHFVFPTKVSSEGILGYSFWGFRRFIAWEHISSARPLRLLNLRWVRLYSSVDGKATYVALFPSHPAAWSAELQRWAPPEFPIFEHFPIRK